MFLFFVVLLSREESWRICMSSFQVVLKEKLLFIQVYWLPQGCAVFRKNWVKAYLLQVGHVDDSFEVP